MSLQTTPYQHRRPHDTDDFLDYHLPNPHHARHHPVITEPRDHRAPHPNADAVSYDSCPYNATRPLAHDGRHGKTEVEPRRIHAVEYKAYEYAPAPAVKDNVGREFADENINEEADQFIRMEHRKFNLIKWMSRTSD